MQLTPVDKATGLRLDLMIDPSEVERWFRPPVGTHLGDVTDMRTWRRYRITAKSCGLELCNCDAYAEELSAPQTATE